jgi:hypothetical protein
MCSVSLCTGVSTLPLFARSPERDGGQMVDFSDFVAVPPLPRRGLKPPWVVTARHLIHAVSRCPDPLSLLPPPVATPAMFIPNPSLRYVSVAVDWSLDVTPFLQALIRSLHVAPRGLT